MVGSVISVINRKMSHVVIVCTWPSLVITKLKPHSKPVFATVPYPNCVQKTFLL